MTLALTVINHLPVSPFDRAFTQKTQTPLARTHAHTHTHTYTHTRTRTHVCIHSYFFARQVCCVPPGTTARVASPRRCNVPAPLAATATWADPEHRARHVLLDTTVLVLLATRWLTVAHPSDDVL